MTMPSPRKGLRWELRLQDEIRPDFTIDQPDSDEHRGEHREYTESLRDPGSTLVHL